MKKQILMLIAAVCFNMAAWSQSSVRKISDDNYMIDGLYYEIDFNNRQAKVYKTEADLTKVSIPLTITVGGKTYTVTAIRDDTPGAFAACSKTLESVSLPASLGRCSFFNVFKGCSKLETINIDENNKEYRSKWGVVHHKRSTGDEICYVPNGYFGPGNGLYMSDKGVNQVSSRAFQGSSLINVVFSPDLIFVQNNAFENCPNLEEIHFWNDKVKILATNFENCPKLKALYFRKDGVEQKMTVNEWKAKQNSQSSAQTPEQLFRLGYDHYVGRNGMAKDYKKAAEYYRQAADQGHASAQANLGLMLRSGKGVAVNLQESMMYFAKAAAQGNATGLVNLGWMYDTGTGVTQDYKEAVKCYRKAAEQGDATAQFNLGLCYEKGKGVPKDMGLAKFWYSKAAAQGDSRAADKLK